VRGKKKGGLVPFKTNATRSQFTLAGGPSIGGLGGTKGVEGEKKVRVLERRLKKIRVGKELGKTNGNRL